jgi:hypothetical protein
MSKPMLVTLPFVLLLVDYWPLGRFQFVPLTSHSRLNTDKSKETSDQRALVLRLVLEKVPFFALAAVSSFLTFFAQRSGGAVVSLQLVPFETRVANALVSYVSYIGKMIWPHRLAVLYPHSQTLPMWQVAGAGLLLGVVSFLVIRGARRRPYLMVGWLWYLGTLVPVIGLVQVGEQAMADRYTYVPLIGLFVMIAWGIPGILAGWRFRKIVLSLSTGLLLLLLMIVTNFQLKYWQNQITLFEHTLVVTSDNFLVHNFLGTVLAGQGKIQEAIAHYGEALRIKPDYSEAHNNLGNALALQGNIQEAIAHFAEALRINPDLAEAHKNFGVILLTQGKIQEAIGHFAEAVRLKSDYAGAHISLGLAYLMIGDKNSAQEEYKILEKINPDLAKILYRKIFE